MIVKLNNGINWCLFDGADQITYSVIDKDQPIAVGDDLYDATIRYPKKENEGHGPTKEIWLWKNKMPIRQILAYSPIYILNDEGKTIERI